MARRRKGMRDRPGRSSKAAAEHRQVQARRTGAPGRPSIFSAEFASLICEQISTGKSLREICAKPGMPSKTTVMRWLGENDKEEFRDRYARARENQADTLADDTVAIADSVAKEKNGVKVQAARLRVDARKWMASKLRPKVYGDKVEIGGDVVMSHRVAQPLDWHAIEARVEAKLRARKPVQRAAGPRRVRDV